MTPNPLFGIVGRPRLTPSFPYRFARTLRRVNPVAQFALDDLYQEGRGVPQDYAQSALWYRKAAEWGNPVAQHKLGALYLGGQGVPQNNTEAYFWFLLASAGKLDTSNAKLATEGRDKAASFLTPAALSQVQERARIWFEEHPAKS